MALYLFTKRLPIKNVCTRTITNRYAQELEYKKCYKILGVSEGCDQEEIRAAYLELVKRFHPDSGNAEANAEKFQEIDKAFKTLINKKSKERWDVEDVAVQEQNIKHTAPQHRQYLSYDGVGGRTPYEREKYYTKSRAMQAVENVYQHRVNKITADDKALLDKNQTVKHNIKTKYGLDRLVEDLIQESISKGEFTNLAGSGKPLNNHQNRNPYVDFITHKLNEVLIENGFTPEWITLQKEIRSEAHHLRSILFYERQFFGPFPLNIEDNILWSEIVYKYKKMVDEINKKIAKFNLVVPIMDKQMLHISLEKEAQKAIKDGKSFKHEGIRKTSKESEETKQTGHSNIFGFIEQFFKNK